MKEGLVGKIKSRGYWRVHFQPIQAAAKSLSLRDSRRVIARNQVTYREWGYPYVPGFWASRSGFEVAGNLATAWVDSTYHKEFWNVTPEGHFLHCLALREDWFLEYGRDKEMKKEMKPMEYIELVGSLIYQMTEFFELLFRLTKAGWYVSGARVEVGLQNTLDRALWLKDIHAPTVNKYKSSQPNILFSNTYTDARILAGPKSLAVQAIVSFLNSFGWTDPPVDMIRHTQDRLFLGKAAI